MGPDWEENSAGFREPSLEMSCRMLILEATWNHLWRRRRWRQGELLGDARGCPHERKKWGAACLGLKKAWGWGEGCGDRKGQRGRSGAERYRAESQPIKETDLRRKESD